MLTAPNGARIPRLIGAGQRVWRRTDASAETFGWGSGEELDDQLFLSVVGVGSDGFRPVQRSLTSESEKEKRGRRILLLRIPLLGL